MISGNSTGRTLRVASIAGGNTEPDPRPAPIPVLRPRLPSAEAILPYLKKIDQERVYSNWGPLVQEFSERLCTTFSLPPGCVITANSGTSALMGAILAVAGYAPAQRRLALVPDFTFAATALAVQLCGYEVVVVPCSRQSWSFSPEQILDYGADVLREVGLIVPVAPFGRPVSQAAWKSFQQRTGIPVVIDGAACFEALMDGDMAGEIPVALSFHATKSFGVGEGGCVVSSKPAIAERVFQALNFGFLGSRDSALLSLNGKMSEYAAAVGLAELDGWREKRNAYLGAFHQYKTTMRDIGRGRRLWGPPEISSSYVLLECTSSGEAAGLMQALEWADIGSRLWYGLGIRQQTQFKGARCLPEPQDAAVDPACLVGLPVAPDISPEDVARVCAVVRRQLL
jgi:dTDP-4-amino-4,6-dideoxygalactose transaminase